MRNFNFFNFFFRNIVASALKSCIISLLTIYLSIFVYCSTGDTALRDFYIMTLKKGIPLFNLNVSTFDAYYFLAVKDPLLRKNFRKSPNFICGIGINDNEICQEICPNIYEFELLIEHQKNAHNVEYSAEFFELDHSSSEFLSKPENDTVEKNPESDTTVDESSESDPVDKSSESDKEDQNSESDNENKNNCVECVEKDNRICPKTGSTEEINRHLVDHFLAELNHFATLSGPAMDKACGKCPAELGNNRFHTFNFIINNRQSSVFCSWNS